MEVFIFIGSLQGSRWTHLRKSLQDINFMEISNDLIYTSWNRKYIKTSCLPFDDKTDLSLLNSVVDRPWFLNLVQRWCSPLICDYSFYLSECRKYEIALLQFLRQFSIKKCFCLYGIAHHVWNNIVESSLWNLGVESIKLYPLLDTNYSILLTGENELNRPFKSKYRPSDSSPILPEIYDALLTTLIKSMPKYTSKRASIWRILY